MYSGVGKNPTLKGLGTRLWSGRGMKLVFRALFYEFSCYTKRYFYALLIVWVIGTTVETVEYSTSCRLWWNIISSVVALWVPQRYYLTGHASDQDYKEEETDSY